MNIIGPFKFLALILFQSILIFIISLVFNAIKKSLGKHFPANFNSSDLFPFIFGLYIYQISLDKHSISCLPQVLMFWLILGIIFGIFYLIRFQEASILKYYKIFWKMGIIYMFVAWIGTIIFYGYQIL
ncbi:DUF3397 family protein [Apilactobacillus micheneri]|uniref:DUF3397 family protein n=1 Tax=Apilactobacillus micheneri TaxID=1899430 RepID=A0ABY2YXZ7_9LACO|nr:DUF3397 family protein [Apilactobacillus micheneri]TPR26852.1 DUF3397 family protein [Apilactobacillus micheneri]TPR28640.1 DUF3397 family protein [Apilactobacillus micheneri]TPR29327.1 DUF3397 family protein [Apilactobacillus micheneri]TPR30915.1 DUF3397 family protein [Apilactobacillus micheneri]